VNRVRHRGPICHLVPYIFVERRYRPPRIVMTFACRRVSVCCITGEIDNAKLWGRGHPPPIWCSSVIAKLARERPPWRSGQPRRTGDAGPALGARLPAKKFKVVSRVGDSELAATSHACGWNEAVKSSLAEGEELGSNGLRICSP
jgi:hypothetical protein